MSAETAAAEETTPQPAVTSDEAEAPRQNWRLRLTGEIGRAVERKQTCSLLYKGSRRQGEPHRVGLLDGTWRLLLYQTGGRSTSAQPEGWKALRLTWIDDFDAGEGTFEPRTVPEDGTGDGAWSEIAAGTD